MLTPSLLMAADSGCLLTLPLAGKELEEDNTLKAIPGAYDYQAYSDDEDYSEWNFITAANGLVVEAHEYGLILAHRYYLAAVSVYGLTFVCQLNFKKSLYEPILNYVLWPPGPEGTASYGASNWTGASSPAAASSPRFSRRTRRS